MTLLLLSNKEVGMDYRTAYGVIHYGGPCCDDYANMRIYDQPPAGGGAVVKLQAPAMKAFKAAELRYARRTNRAWRPIALSGSWRSCAYQESLHRRDPARYASAAASGHCRGLAIDVNTAVPNQAIIRACLKLEGWKQSRPDDEPWHYSFFLVL